MGEHRVPEAAEGRGRDVTGSTGAASRPTRGGVDAGASTPAPRPVISVAPMMDLTDRHYRYVARLLSRRVLLYSEMITAKAVLFGDAKRLLAFSSAESPVVLQLGGDDPAELAAAAVIGEGFGYAEVNLNVGCPSERVSSGNFGACLMASPELVGECLAAIAAAVAVPVSVKHRIGIDERDSYRDLLDFVDRVDSASGGAPVAYTVHARKAWLSGLSPKENRTVPPLRYEEVHRLKRERPHLTIELNGGVTTLLAAREQLRFVDGVMIGRAAYENPVVLADVDPLITEEQSAVVSRASVIEALLPYLEAHLASGGRLAAVTRHLLQLFRGVPGGRAWRRTLSEGAHRPGVGVGLLEDALRAVPSEVARAPLGTPAASGEASESETPEVLLGDDQVLDLVGAFADAR